MDSIQASERNGGFTHGACAGRVATIGNACG